MYNLLMRSVDITRRDPTGTPRPLLRQKETQRSNYLVIKSVDPTRTDPTGAPKPLLRHKETLSQCLVREEGGRLRAAAAFSNRAPSKCIGSFRVLHTEPSCGWENVDISTHREIFSESCQSKPNLDCNFTFSD